MLLFVNQLNLQEKICTRVYKSVLQLYTKQFRLLAVPPLAKIIYYHLF